MSGLDIASLFGSDLEGVYLMIFSMRLDETGTDGRSGFVTVGGAVALKPHWDDLEAQWDAYLKLKKVPAFHLIDFDPPRQGAFEDWSDLKCSFFEKRLNKIIDSNMTFRCAISIDSAAHKAVKEKMRGIKGFAADSDYSLCLRFLMFHACEVLSKIDPRCQLAILVEHGPWVAGAMETYQKVAGMRAKWKPAKHAHRLAGFASRPKGIRSLEAADYIAGREHSRLIAGKRPSGDDNRLCHLLTADDLETWYQGMMREKEYRRAYEANRKKGV